MFRWFRRRPQKKLDWRELVVEPTGSRDFGPCECCGNMGRTVWGFVHGPEATVAAYYVQWTLNKPEHGANFDVIVGDWGSRATTESRQAVALEYRDFAEDHGFMVIDAEARPDASALAAKALRRVEVMGTPLAETVFAVADAVFAREARIEEIRRWGLAPGPKQARD